MPRRTYKKRDFTLLEMMVALVILGLAASTVAVQVAKLVKAYRFEKEVAGLYIHIQEVQVLAVTYQTNISLDIEMAKGSVCYRFSSDEPFKKALFRQDRVAMPLASSLRFNNKKVKNHHFDIYSSGVIEPRGVLSILDSSQEVGFRLDTQYGALVKLSKITNLTQEKMQNRSK